jgi:hypothetical protein
MHPNLLKTYFSPYLSEKSKIYCHKCSDLNNQLYGYSTYCLYHIVRFFGLNLKCPLKA